VHEDFAEAHGEEAAGVALDINVDSNGTSFFGDAH
jgi:hypothetical protein